MEQQTIYYAEIFCQGTYKSGKKKGESCGNKAYFDVDGTYLCGVHARGQGIQLPKNPHKKEKKQQELLDHNDLCEKMADENLANNQRGNIEVAKLGMRKAVPHLDGYVKIFPNFKHGGRKDGIGLPSLSPMSLGPIEHGYPGIPFACNLENFHQGAKVFPGEVDVDNKLTLDALAMRRKMYEDTTPYRHKFDVPYYTGNKPEGKNPNIPLFAIHYTKEGEEVRYNYLESRYFYCHWYEKLVKREPDFAFLNKLLDEGFNLLIIGYDGYEVNDGSIVEVLWNHYNDTSRPFGHELVLYTLLVLDNPDDYPWNRYYRENSEIYMYVI